MTEQCSDCEDAKMTRDWHFGKMGETIEREFKCDKCGLSWREVWVYSCLIDKDTDEVFG